MTLEVEETSMEELNYSHVDVSASFVDLNQDGKRG